MVPELGELLCPVCRRLTNCILPARTFAWRGPQPHCAAPHAAGPHLAAPQRPGASAAQGPAGDGVAGGPVTSFPLPRSAFFDADRADPDAPMHDAPCPAEDTSPDTSAHMDAPPSPDAAAPAAAPTNTPGGTTPAQPAPKLPSPPPPSCASAGSAFTPPAAPPLPPSSPSSASLAALLGALPGLIATCSGAGLGPGPRADPDPSRAHPPASGPGGAAEGEPPRAVPPFLLRHEAAAAARAAEYEVLFGTEGEVLNQIVNQIGREGIHHLEQVWCGLERGAPNGSDHFNVLWGTWAGHLALVHLALAHAEWR